MLTKDIELIPAITDLVDNSVDGAISLRPKRNFDGLHISLDVQPGSFRIEDDCGGIPVPVARDYAFRFGRPEDFAGIEGSVGQFGVGMKRALFKLGSLFRIESRTETSRFVLVIDVDAWAADDSPDWSFQFQDVDENYKPPENAPAGTVIQVERLHPSVGGDFGLSQTVAGLKTDLQLRHQQALASGMNITLNGDSLRPTKPALLRSAKFSPLRKKRKVTANGYRVDLDLFAGIARARDDDRDEEAAEAFLTPGDAGWYLYCNDRLVFAADKSALTGWGRGAAAYHPQYRDFRGYAFLRAKNASHLPWNTTKTGVDQDSPIFRQVQAEMASALKIVQAVVNRAKKERAGRPADESPLLQAIADAKEVPLEDISESATPKVPTEKPTTPSSTRITYSVANTEFDAVQEELGASTASEVGRETFRYFYDREVGEP